MKKITIRRFTRGVILSVWGIGCLLYASISYANNVAVAEVALTLPTASTVQVNFNLSQDNPFGDLTDANSQPFSDYIWVFIKYDTDTNDETVNGWLHATLIQSGSSSAFTVTSNGKGAFIKASDAAANLKLVWNYSADGVLSSNTARVKVMAIEMVYIPQGQFIYDAGGIGTVNYNNYNGTAQATVSDTTMVPTGASTGWPNGFNAFYIMKYEVSHGQYADFLNTISASAAGTDGTGRYYPIPATPYRYTITYTGGNPYGSRYATLNPNRTCNFLSWDDVKAYCSWAALRPMTEMEFEKAARGGGGTNINKYPWSSTDPATTTYTPVSEGVAITKDYACFNSSPAGPINVGHYLSGDVSRTNEQTGASPYGVADMAGNVWEHLINCAWTTTPANGNGSLTPPSSWPGAASGKGIRGGGWGGTVASGGLRVSDRVGAGWSDTARGYHVGFRAVRTP